MYIYYIYIASHSNYLEWRKLGSYKMVKLGAANSSHPIGMKSWSKKKSSCKYLLNRANAAGYSDWSLSLWWDWSGLGWSDGFIYAKCAPAFVLCGKKRNAQSISQGLILQSVVVHVFAQALWHWTASASATATESACMSERPSMRLCSTQYMENVVSFLLFFCFFYIRYQTNERTNEMSNMEALDR